MQIYIYYVFWKDSRLDWYVHVFYLWSIRIFQNMHANISVFRTVHVKTKPNSKEMGKQTVK